MRNPCSQALFDAGASIAQIQNYLITHSHADHVGGLEEVQLFARYVRRKKPNMVITRTYEKILWEQSLRGGSELSENEPLGFGDLWNAIRPRKLKGYPRETFEANVGSINIKMPRTMHFPDRAKNWRECAWSCAVIIDDRILFTSDTGLIRNSLKALTGCLTSKSSSMTARCLPAACTLRLMSFAPCQRGLERKSS